MFPVDRQIVKITIEVVHTRHFLQYRGKKAAGAEALVARKSLAFVLRLCTRMNLLFRIEHFMHITLLFWNTLPHALPATA